MEEINKNYYLKNFISSISKKYDLEENILINNLNNDRNHFWEILFQIINKKSELIISENKNKEINNENINKNPNEIFNKEELEKEIEEFFNSNPEEDRDIWNKYKNGSIKYGNGDKNNFDTPTSMTTVKKQEINKNKSQKFNSPDKRKKSMSISQNNQRFNFSSEMSNRKRHQSILFQIQKFNKFNSKNFMRNTSFKKNTNKTQKRSKFFNSPNRNRKSLFLKIDHNPNLKYYNSKKNSSVKNRRSVFIPKNNIKNKLSLNDSPIKEIKKNILNIKQNKEIKNENIENNEKEKFIFYPNESDSDSLNKSDSINSDNESKEIENKIITKNDLNKIIEEKKEPILKSEKPIIHIYKNKNTILTIHRKEKLNHRTKRKRYLNISICHQIEIFLKAVLNNISKKKNNNLRKQNEVNIYPMKKKQKFDKINNQFSNKTENNINQNNNNFNIKLQEDKKYNKKFMMKFEYKNQKIDKEEDNYNLIINKNKCNYEQKNKMNISTAKINNIYQNSLKNIFGINNFNSDNNIKTFKKENKNNNENNEFYKPQMTTISKKKEIKYFNMSSNKYLINSQYKNICNRYGNIRLIKGFKIKKNKSTKYKIESTKSRNKVINKKKYNDNSYNNNLSLNNNFSDKNLYSKKKNYLERYKEAIENIIKYDDSIYNDENDIFYLKNDNKINDEKKEKNKNRKIKLFLNKNSKNIIPKIKVKKNYYCSSCENIRKEK